MTLIEEIIKLGLTPKEASLYLSALELGRFSVAGISQKTGIKRPTCYLIVDELVKKGLLSKIAQTRKTLYLAEPPENLLRQIEKNFNLAKDLIPRLKGITKKVETESFIKFFSGEIGVESIYNDMLKEKPKIIYGILSPEDLFRVTGKQFLDQWIKKRIEMGIKVLSLQVRSKNKKEKFFYGDSSQLLRDVRYLPENISFPTLINIYGEKVSFVSSKEGNLSFIIKSQEFHGTMKALFDIAWSISSEMKI